MQLWTKLFWSWIHKRLDAWSWSQSLKIEFRLHSPGSNNNATRLGSQIVICDTQVTRHTMLPQHMPYAPVFQKR